MAPIYVSEHIDRWALNGWNFQPRKQLLSLTSAVLLTLLSWNIEQRRRMWTATWCGLSRRSTMLRGWNKGWGGLNRCWGRAWIYTHFRLLLRVLSAYFLVFFSSSGVHLCTWQRRGGSPEWFNLFHHLNEIIAENHCTGFNTPCFCMFSKAALYCAFSYVNYWLHLSISLIT